MKINSINATTISAAIKYSANDRKHFKDLYKRIAGLDIPISKREYTIDGVIQTGKINNKLANDFPSEIVSMKTGYLVGVPIKYDFNRADYSEAQQDTIGNLIWEIGKYNNIDKLDSELVRYISACSTAYRLCYITVDQNNVNRITLANLEPWAVTMLDNLAIYQYSQSSIETDGLIKTEYLADVFTDTEIITYKALTLDGEYKPTGDRQEHGFQRLPVVKFQNNPELRGDFEGALELIDAYDRILSDVDNELEQFRLAYLALSGVGRLEQADIDALKQTGVFSFEQVGGKAEFIVKNINKEVIEFMLKKLEQNILHFSQTPNFREESFAGQQSGVALEFKFRPFEFNCVKTEREVSAGLRNQYRVIADYVNILDTSLNFNYLDMEFMFTRNLPTNTLEEAQIQATLKGLITDKTRLSLFSKIGDAEDELQAMTEEGVSMNNFTGLNNES